MNGNFSPQNQRGQGQNQNKYDQGNNRVPFPRGQTNQNVDMKEYHQFCGRYHVRRQCWSEGQDYGYSNCGGPHPSDECHQPDKIISMPNHVTNSQQQVQENMRGAQLQGAVANDFRPPNLYYDHESARQTFHSPAGLQTANGYILI